MFFKVGEKQPFALSLIFEHYWPRRNIAVDDSCLVYLRQTKGHLDEYLLSGDQISLEQTPGIDLVS